MRLRSAALLAALVLSSACAGTTPAPRAEQRGIDAPITEEEIQGAQAADLYTAIQALRPQWLTRRRQQSITGQTPITVYVNRTRLGGVEELRTLPANSATSVVYLSPGQAQYRFGAGNSNGAIVVTTTRSR